VVTWNGGSEKHGQPAKNKNYKKENAKERERERERERRENSIERITQ